MLFNLEKDIGETTDVADKNPEIVQKLSGYIKEMEKELGEGKNLSDKCRPSGLAVNPQVLKK